VVVQLCLPGVPPPTGPSVSEPAWYLIMGRARTREAQQLPSNGSSLRPFLKKKKKKITAASRLSQLVSAKRTHRLGRLPAAGDPTGSFLFRKQSDENAMAYIIVHVYSVITIVVVQASLYELS